MATINIMALRHSAFYSPLLMSIAGGFLEAEGLQPNYIVATPDNTVPDNILSGSCHVAQSAVATSFAGLEAGETSPIVHFAQINQKDGFFIAGRSPEPDFAWTDLVGKTILVDHFFQPLGMFKYGMHKQGIDIDNMTIVDMGDVDSIDKAFRDGHGDYVHQQGPSPQMLEQEGIAHIVASVGDAVGTVAFSSLCAHQDWLESDMARAFMRAYRKARDLVAHAEPTEIAAKEMEGGFFTNIDSSVLISTIAAYQKSGCWAGDVDISRQSYENLLDVFIFNGLIRQRYSYEAVVVQPPR